MSARRITRKPKAPDYHAQITPGIVSVQKLTAALETLRLDLAVTWIDDVEILNDAYLIAGKIYDSFEDLAHAYNMARAEVQETMGNALFLRLEGAGEAKERRLVVAAYFLGVQCGRMTQPRNG